MAKCYVCGDTLHEKTNLEHIIKKSFGGSLASRQLLCDYHNGELNNLLDNKISEEIDWMYDSLDYNKSSKKRITLYHKESGEKVQFGVGLRPLFPLKYEENGVIVRTEYYNSEEEAKRKAEEYAKQKRGKNETWEFNLKDQEPIQTYFFTKDGVAGFGSDVFHLTFLKSAISFFMYNGGEREYVATGIDVLMGNVVDTKLTRFFYSSLHSIAWVNDEVCHFMYLRGCPEQKLLYCYIELFSTHKMLVFLSSKYEGEEIEAQYCRDIINKKLINKDFKLHLSRNHYDDYYEGRCKDYQKEHDSCYQRILSIIGKLAMERNKDS